MQELWDQTPGLEARLPEFELRFRLLARKMSRRYVQGGMYKSSIQGPYDWDPQNGNPHVGRHEH